jgi:outer membrane protein
MFAVLGAAALLWGCSAMGPFARDGYPPAPTNPAKPWIPPTGYERYSPQRSILDGAVAAVPEPGGVYALADLIDLAERSNPETRLAWEKARTAAASLGEAHASWFPVVALAIPGGYYRDIKYSIDGTEIFEVAGVEPRVELSWLLLDFGRREADIEAARKLLIASNFAFNRKHQDVAFAVQRSFYTLAAARAGVAAAEQTLEAARMVDYSAKARLNRGLATRPEMLLAVQETARCAYELEDARGRLEDAKAALATSLGILPTVAIDVEDTSAAPLPATLPDTVERAIDATFVQRPDLAARLAELRAREAKIRRARAEFFPRLRFDGGGGGVVRGYNARVPFLGQAGSFEDLEPNYAALLRLEWTLFDGNLREQSLRRAEAEARAARADLEHLELKAVEEVWTAYVNAKTALRKHEFAVALLEASEEAYTSGLKSYQQGLSTLIDLLAAQRDLARARSTLIASRAEVLIASAALAYAMGTSLGQ